MIHKIHFGKRVAAARRRLGLSQTELADKLGVTGQAVSKWECGTALPDVELLLALSHLFGMTVNELLEDADPWRPEAWEMMRRRRDLQFFFVTKRIDRLEKVLEKFTVEYEKFRYDFKLVYGMSSKELNRMTTTTRRAKHDTAPPVP